MSNTFTFTRPLFGYRHLPRRTTFNLSVPDIASDEYIMLIDRLSVLISQWIDTELHFVDADTPKKKTFIEQLRVINLKILASTNAQYVEDLKNFFTDGLSKRTTHRLMELDITLSYSLPKRFIESVKGNIYQTLANKEVLGLPSALDWYDAQYKYPFCWILFVMQNVIRTNMG